MTTPAQLSETQLHELAANTRDMLSFDRMVTLAFFLLNTADLPGAVVEFGCYEGKTAALMAALTKKELYLFDSFKGLPEPMAQDAGRDAKYQEGSMLAHQNEVVHNFLAGGLTDTPIICAKWFADVTAEDMPERISFCHCDSDMYRSTHEALALVYPRLVKDGVIICDDFGDPGLPGVEKAVREFFADAPEKLVVPLGRNGEPTRQCYIIKEA